MCAVASGEAWLLGGWDSELKENRRVYLCRGQAPQSLPAQASHWSRQRLQYGVSRDL